MLLRLLASAALLFSALPSATFVSAGPHIKPTADPANALVQTDCGLVQGVPNYHYEVNYWRGIPYGSRQLGNKRWKPSTLRVESGDCWAKNSVLDATQYPPMCIQQGTPSAFQSEDCLYLNIWSPAPAPVTPDANSPANLPVMVYIHGGSLLTGDGGNVDSNPVGFMPERVAVQGNVIVVTIQYRLNVLGALALPELSAADPRGVSGNYAITDAQTALRWVQQNIAQFGGDKNRVTLFGQSSGGTVILGLLASPASAGLFHAAIPLSASPKIDVPLTTTQQMNEDQFVPSSPCAGKSGKQLLECLYRADPFELANSYNATTWAASFLFGIAQPGDVQQPLVFVDGVTIPRPLKDSLSSALIDVPVVFGNMAEEPDLFPVDILDGYNSTQYYDYISSRFSAFGSDVVTSVSKLYPFEKFQSAQQASDQIVADKGTICGNNELALLASQHFTSPIYRIVTTQGPSTPTCFLYGYCATYAHHMWDALALFKNLGYNMDLNADDLALSNEYLAQFTSIAYNKTTVPDSAWKAVNAVAPDQPTTILVSKSTVTQVNYKQAECAFWDTNGFPQWWWQN